MAIWGSSFLIVVVIVVVYWCIGIHYIPGSFPFNVKCTLCGFTSLPCRHPETAPSALKQTPYPWFQTCSWPWELIWWNSFALPPCMWVALCGGLAPRSGFWQRSELFHLLCPPGYTTWPWRQWLQSYAYILRCAEACSRSSWNYLQSRA